MNKILFIITILLGLSTALRVCDKTLIITEDRSLDKTFRDAVGGEIEIISPLDFKEHSLIDLYEVTKYCNVLLYLPTSPIGATAVAEISRAVKETPQYSHFERYEHINEDSGVNMILITSPYPDRSVRNFASNFGVEIASGTEKDVLALSSEYPSIAEGASVIKTPGIVTSLQNFEGQFLPIFTYGDNAAGAALQSTITNTRISILSFDLQNADSFRDLVNWTFQRKSAFRIKSMTYNETTRTIKQFSSLDRVKFDIVIEKFDNEEKQWIETDLTRFRPQLYLVLANDEPLSVYDLTYEGNGIHSATATMMGRANVKAVVDFHRPGVSHVEIEKLFLTTAIAPHDLPKRHTYGMPTYATAFFIGSLFVMVPIYHEILGKKKDE